MTDGHTGIRSTRSATRGGAGVRGGTAGGHVGPSSTGLSPTEPAIVTPPSAGSASTASPSAGPAAVTPPSTGSALAGAGRPLPRARGPITAWLFDRLARPPHRFDPPPLPGPARPVNGAAAVDVPPAADPAPLLDEDLQLALFACYELHYQGFDGVDERWEWNPSLLETRGILEARFEEGLARAVPRPSAGPELSAVPRSTAPKPPVAPVPSAGPKPSTAPKSSAVPVPSAGPAAWMRRALTELVAADDGPALSAYLQREADLEQFREFVVHRSIYHLKEADPHTWAIPRLRGQAKAALVEIQTDEYGGGRAERMHAELFRVTMRRLGLDDSYGAYLDRVPAVTLAISNTMSLFGLHRRHRGALLGHLAAFEMTSSLPNRRYGRGLRRLGGDEAACSFYDEHVQADAVHEQIAAHDMCGGFAAAHPELAGDVLYGAACALALDRLFATHVLACWRRGATSLREHGGGEVTSGPGR
ncbi:hypothetical protein F4562_003994 [Streptosporangium becharense]|uniref:Iron-containing redox enzyme family protein n=1 Tax=Streptosporangium becharense TaxID=1816182 RepID=A0A7W9MHA1_9ACTN|nr:hypothetical protein [Streptosporangium becharense]